jgi:hypothetical protein
MKPVTRVYNDRIELTINGSRYAKWDGEGKHAWMKHHSHGNWDTVSYWGRSDETIMLNEIAKSRQKVYHCDK